MLQQQLCKGLAKAWANLNGTGTIALRDSFNVSSVTDDGTGDYDFTYYKPIVNHAKFSEQMEQIY